MLFRSIAGRVLLKDGVTPVAGADLLLTESGGQTQFQGSSSRSGRYKVRLPVGSYNLRIVQGADYFTSPAVYRVSAGVRNQIDFLVIPDFEKPAGADVKASDAATHAEKRGPDPAPAGLTEVGTIVDMVHEQSSSRWHRWAETLGFIGSLLLVSLAAG